MRCVVLPWQIYRTWLIHIGLYLVDSFFCAFPKSRFPEICCSRTSPSIIRSAFLTCNPAVWSVALWTSNVKSYDRDSREAEHTKTDTCVHEAGTRKRKHGSLLYADTLLSTYSRAYLFTMYCRKTSNRSPGPVQYYAHRTICHIAMPEPNISTCQDGEMWQIFVRWWRICCTTSCRIVVSSSVGGVVQHVRSRCPCSGVWHYSKLTTIRRINCMRVASHTALNIVACLAGILNI